MGWDKHAAATYARQHAGSSSHSRCAEFTRIAINAGGGGISNTRHAKDYGSVLEAAGFHHWPGRKPKRRGCSNYTTLYWR